MNFDGKTVLVTGGGRGIGKAIADAFYQNGANVCITVRDAKRIACQYDAERSLVLEFDYTKNLSGIDDFIEKIINKFGRIDCLVNNVGIDKPVSIFEMTEDHLNEMMRVNFISAVMTSKAVAKYMVVNRYGKMVSLSSIAGKQGTDMHIGYSATKHAIIGFTQSLSKELIPYNISVNCVCPGLINTDMLHNFFTEYSSKKGTGAEVELSKMIQQTPRGQIGDPKEVANLIMFLCSDLSTNIVGQSINCDGGYLYQ